VGQGVETRWGRVAGREEDGIHVFRGIPYARPPVGALRFRAPEPPEPRAGVRDCSEFGPSAIQNPMLLRLPGMGVGRQSEDCLYLNVWTPGLDGARRPVLVWIHGGGFVIGSSSQGLYDGAPLARRGDVVVVTLNYRLGPLGFLFLADLCPQLEGATANAGMRDQVAALTWVNEHVAAFGGDPGNVTIFGESAGGMSVGTLMGMPSARGLFQRAIPQSGASHNFHDRETATKVAEAFLETHGLSAADAGERLRDVPAGQLLESSQQTFLKLGSSLGLLPFQPLVDGDSLPEPPLDAIRAGQVAPVPLLTGTTRDEWRLFALLDPEVPRIDLPGLVAKLRRRLSGVDVEALVATYRRARQERGEPADPPSLFFAIQTDLVFRIPAIRLAEAQAAHQAKTFLYRFDQASPAFGGSLGACHAIELLFVFGTHDHPGAATFVGSGDGVRALSERTMDAWLAFARSGEPGHPGLEPWPAYEPERRATMLLGPESRLACDPQGDERRCWDGVV
jgi:para-nitrobenzyl esterase